MKINLMALFISSVLLVSCNENTQETKAMTPEVKPVVQRNVDPVQYSKGQKLFLMNCAACHGKYAQGAKNWQIPDKDGKYLAPPLNGTAHTWHHSNKALTITIKNGTSKIGGNMPAWKDKLSEGEIMLILIWIKAQWSDEIYTAWYNQFHKEK
jgi:mono/diheme cytochrome c family protein